VQCCELTACEPLFGGAEAALIEREMRKPDANERDMQSQEEDFV
jgi:hypothetical protein